MCELARSDRFSHSSIFFSLYAYGNSSLAVDLSSVELLLIPTASTVDSILFPFLGPHPLCSCSLSSPSRNPPSHFVLSSRYSSHTTRPFQPAIWRFPPPVALTYVCPSRLPLCQFFAAQNLPLRLLNRRAWLLSHFGETSQL